MARSVGIESSNHYKELVGRGVDPEEASLIARAIRLGQYSDRSVGVENYALRTIRRSVQGGKGDRGRAFRKFQQKVIDELLKVPAERIAFGDVPDSIREQNSAFYYTMHSGNQARFLDRHEDETPEEYLDRPSKVTLNITKLIIKVLSKLYHKVPLRELNEATPEHIADRLKAIWSSKSFNLGLLDADKLTRLLGTVAVRPMYDPTLKGKVRLWIFMCHQLRVIPDPERPWRPQAVIERVQPFGNSNRIAIWTDKSFVTVGGGEVTYVEHELGRIPHVFCRDERSYTSFFVEGRGRLLAEPNAVLNNSLSDLEEVKRMQGFATMQLVNPTEDEYRVGPRQVFVFNPKSSDDPYGVEFKKPNAPIKELIESANDFLQKILLSNDVPPAALGAEINKRSLSGNAIAEAMAPIQDDLDERARTWEPIEWDLADSVLRMVKRHEPDFAYDPQTMRPEFTVEYQRLSAPLSTRDKTLRDDFEIAQGITTPPQIMLRDNPDDFEDEEAAFKKWRENLNQMKGEGFNYQDETTDLRATYAEEEGYGEERPAPDAHIPEDAEGSEAILLEELAEAGYVEVGDTGSAD